MATTDSARIAAVAPPILGALRRASTLSFFGQIRHDKGHSDRHRTDCKWCRRARAQERVDLLVAEGKLVQG